MRIIAGIYRHRQIKQPTVLTSRPTKDAVREAIFSAIGPAINGTIVLDLFAGSGAFGIEALSRGARHAILIDHDAACIRTINENISVIGVSEAEVWTSDYRAALKRLEATPMKIDVIFLDPPYSNRMCELALGIIMETDILAPSAIIVAETDHRLMVDEAKFSKVRYYKYGKTHVAIMWR